MVISRSVSKERENGDIRRSGSGEGRPASRSRSRSRNRSHSPRGRRSYSPRRSRSRSRGRRFSRSRSRSRSRSNDDGYRLHIGDLDEECRKADLERVFMKYGPLKEIWLASYAPFYAFVVYRNRMDAQDACSEADGARISGRRIRVTLALPRNKGPRNRFVADRHRGDRRY